MRVCSALVWILIVAIFTVGPVSADVPFPARLQLTEVAAGTYDVAFTLPLVEGRKLRAEPVLPEMCKDVTERETGLTPGGVTTMWQVQCSPESLAGEVILIQGLLGTQTDLAVQIDALDGRKHLTILKPSRPGFVVPSPPPLSSLGADAGLAGMRRVLLSLSLWIVLLVVVFMPVGWRQLVAGVVAFSAGHVVGQWSGGQGWLLVSEHLPPLYALATALVPAVFLARNRSGDDGWVQPFWIPALLLGTLTGGARPETIPPEGLSSVEQAMAAVFFSIGIAGGLFLITAVAYQFRGVISSRPGTEDARLRVIGYGSGILAVGLIVLRLAALSASPETLPRASLAFGILAVLLGAILSRTGVSYRPVLLSFVGLMVVGLLPGLSGVPLPVASLLVLGTLFVLGVILAFNRMISTRWSMIVVGLSVPLFAWFVGESLVDSVSRPVGASVGACLVALVILHASLGAWANQGLAGFSMSARVMGGCAALAAVVWRFDEYGHWFDETVATEVALGLLRLPLLSITAVIVAAFLWPKKRPREAELGNSSRKSFVHRAVLSAAFFILPLGTVAVHNPIFEPHAPENAQARRILTRVLSNTYHAFNIDDEDELFDRLDENITEDLVADVYLDSRRRLTAGTREGAMVTVKDVSVIELGDPLPTGVSGEGFSYDCVWTVTARVQHMQHIHFRHNTYSGVLTIRITGDTWKIAGIDLTSEVKTTVSRSAA